jgi:hypothetical protein
MPVGGAFLILRILEFILIIATLGSAGLIGMISGQLTCNIVTRGQETQAKPVTKPPANPVKEVEEPEAAEEQ